MHIRELANQVGVSATTIRYYEHIGVLPAPARDANNYRQYGSADVERLRFVAGARSLGVSLEEIAAILRAQTTGSAPCAQVLAVLAQRRTAIDRRIAELSVVRDTLAQLWNDGATLPQDNSQAEGCVCALLRSYHEHGLLPSVSEEQPYA